MVALKDGITAVLTMSTILIHMFQIITFEVIPEESVWKL